MLLRFGAVLPLAVLAYAGATAAQSNFDGVYRSRVGAVTGNNACGTTRFGYALRVSNGMAAMQTVSVGELQGRVGPDGSVSIVAGTVSLTGKIAGTHFRGAYTNRSCSFSLEYDKG